MKVDFAALFIDSNSLTILINQDFELDVNPLLSCLLLYSFHRGKVVYFIEPPINFFKSTVWHL